MTAIARLDRTNILKSVRDELRDEYTDDEIDRAARRVAAGMMRAIAASADRAAIDKCSAESIGNVIRQTARDGLELGGIMADCYLVPRGGQLTRPVTHRGLARLMAPEGVRIRCTLVGPEDHMIERFGLAVEHEQVGPRVSDLGSLRAVIVTITRGAGDVEHHVVAGDEIRHIASSRQAGPVWRAWPVQMAIKSAIRWVFARGYVVIPDSVRGALEIDEPQQVEARTDEPPARPGRAMLARLREQIEAPAAEQAEPIEVDLSAEAPATWDEV